MLKNIFNLYDKMKILHNEGVELSEITSIDIIDRIARMKYEENLKNLQKLSEDINKLSVEQFNVISV